MLSLMKTLIQMLDFLNYERMAKSLESVEWFEMTTLKLHDSRTQLI